MVSGTPSHSDMFAILPTGSCLEVLVSFSDSCHILASWKGEGRKAKGPLLPFKDMTEKLHKPLPRMQAYGCPPHRGEWEM